MSNSTFHIRDPELTRRNELYLSILRRGLVDLRSAAWDGRVKCCEIESDHLHNIPAYIAGGDAANHLYYLTVEVPFFLERSARERPEVEEQLRLYAPLWSELETLVPVAGSPWERQWNELRAKRPPWRNLPVAGG